MTAPPTRIISLWLLLLIAMVTQVTSRPSPKKNDSQVLQDLFLLLNQPEIPEGSAQSPAPSHDHGRGLSVRPLKDFLTRQRKWRGRSRKGFGRGCFGMKVDRIGALSGLGC